MHTVPNILLDIYLVFVPYDDNQVKYNTSLSNNNTVNISPLIRCPHTVYLYYEGRSINKLQNSVILLVFQI